MTVETPVPGFRELGLSEPLLQALAGVGYESPSPIQARTIPLLLSGSDLLGQAQTGTGKTAAFALPVLAQLDLASKLTQAIVLTPTRELAIQVAEAFQKYAAFLPGFHVLPIYGGQSYTPQLKGLKRGAHVIVGTPGRVMDHMKRGALSLANLRFLVLDEGDEMLQMGFVDDIDWILEQTPKERQIALFSATLPPAIRRIAQKHMRDPKHVTIEGKTATAANIRQRAWLVSGLHKLDALTRLLEVERFDAMLVFVRTKLETTDLAERLAARGFDAAPLNGDIHQQQRERTIARLKNGELDIVVATDVAARGLDVERISHVINYDIPYDSETYIHRIGRTGRAGRSGEAILFVAPRERNMLRIIERVTRQRIEQLTLPSVADVNEQRVQRFKERVTTALQSGEGQVFRELLEQLEREQNAPAIEIAAALAGMLQGSSPFLLAQRGDAREGGAPTYAGSDSANDDRRPRDRDSRGRDDRPRREGAAPRRDDRPPRERSAHSRDDRPPRDRDVPVRDDRPPRTERAPHVKAIHSATHEASRPPRRERQDESPAPSVERPPSIEQVPPFESAPPLAEGAAPSTDAPLEHYEDTRPVRPPRSESGLEMETYRVEVGHVHGLQPGNLVGAIANEAGLDGKNIGHIDIRDDHAFVDLPVGMPKEILRELKKVRVRGTEMQMSRVSSKPPKPPRAFNSDRKPAHRRDR